MRTVLLKLHPLQDEQFGFKVGASTDFQRFRVTEAIRDGFERKEIVGAVFLDLASAFDTVWKAGLVKKMRGIGLSTALVRLIESYLSGREFAIKTVTFCIIQGK